MAVKAVCAWEPVTPNLLPRDDAQNRKDIDWRTGRASRNPVP